ncbi:MAG TPA: RNA polymerase sigma factor [Opitutaceae bacterium]|jgi:RNA polymerase sigma-70 factor (ECF subfamily)
MHSHPDVEPLFKSWIEEHGGIIQRIARSFAKNAADAEDLRQEMLLQLWVTAPKFSQQSKASTWIYRISFNTALMWHRGASRRNRRIDSECDLSQIQSGGMDPAEGVAQGERLAQLYDSIRTMSKSDRTLVLMMLDDLSYREIAEVTGLTENQVGVGLTRARKRLMEIMKGVTNELG